MKTSSFNLAIILVALLFALLLSPSVYAQGDNSSSSSDNSTEAPTSPAPPPANSTTNITTTESPPPPPPTTTTATSTSTATTTTTTTTTTAANTTTTTSTTMVENTTTNATTTEAPTTPAVVENTTTTTAAPDTTTTVGNTTSGSPTTTSTTTTTSSTNTTTTTSASPTTTTIGLPSIPIIYELRFYATFPYATTFEQFQEKLTQFYADKATGGDIVYQVHIKINDNRTQHIGSQFVDFTFLDSGSDHQIGNKAATFFVEITDSERSSYFGISSLCVYRTKAQADAAGPGNTSIGNGVDVCEGHSDDWKPQNAAVAVVIVLFIIVLLCCCCWYCYKKWSEDNKDGQPGSGNNNQRHYAVDVNGTSGAGDDPNESHLPPGMRRRAREEMQRAHMQAQAGYVVNDGGNFVGMDDTSMGGGEDTNPTEMSPREATSAAVDPPPNNTIFAAPPTQPSVPTVYDEIINEDQYSGASAMRRGNASRW